MLVTTSRDKKIRVWDVRAEKPVHEAPGHPGAKNSRAVWMGEHNRFATAGFSRMSERQLALWEPGRSEPIGGFSMLDSISGVIMPFWGQYWKSTLRKGQLLNYRQMTDPIACILLARGKWFVEHSAVLGVLTALAATATSDTTSTRTTSSNI